jgi:hypothetical protein
MAVAVAAGAAELSGVVESETVKKKGATMSAIKPTRAAAVTAAAVASESVYAARLTLKEWLTHLENAGLLKPGATSRILTNRKLKKIILPAPVVAG